MKDMEKIQQQKDIYNSALEALNKSKLKDIILKYSNLDKQVSYTLVQDPADMRIVWKLRRKVFVDEENYPPKSIRNTLDRGAIHFLSKKDSIAVGSISIYLDSVTGLPIEKLLGLNLSKYKKDGMAEIEKLAVLPQYRKTTIPLSLMVIAYEFIKFFDDHSKFIKLSEIRKICIFTLSRKRENIALYKKFGFKKILEFDIFNSEKATCLMLDITKDSVYEKILLMNMRRTNFVKQLAEMLSFKIIPNHENRKRL